MGYKGLRYTWEMHVCLEDLRQDKWAYVGDVQKLDGYRPPIQ